MVDRSGLSDVVRYHQRAAAILLQGSADRQQREDADRHLEWVRSIEAIQGAVEILCVRGVTITDGQRAVRTIIQNAKGGS